jgi:hypothetical protein
MANQRGRPPVDPDDPMSWRCRLCDVNGVVDARLDTAIDIALAAIADHATKAPTCPAPPDALTVRLAENMFFNCALPDYHG